ncbi:MAG: 6-phosphofructokinase [Deltaproteobacteria bacterium]|nr:6-phosphofructokinase [Deltaproteobacteria bacterium]
MNRKFNKTLAILVGGGPAPGINGVIRSATIEGVKAGLDVIGIHEGYNWLAKEHSRRIETLTIDKVSRIHYRGGSILSTSRVNPTKDPVMMDTVIKNLTALEVDYLISIGGDDTAYTASQLVKRAGDQIQVAHVPKTIDNDLPLPGRMVTFGFETAREAGANLVKNIMEDAYTTRRWYIVVTMGRSAGHLALGIGNAAGATLTVIGEEFRKTPIKLSHLCDILEGAIIKRRLLGKDYGVAVLSEGIIESIDQTDLLQNEVERDAHGNIRYAEIALAEMLKDSLRKRLKARGIDCTLVKKDIGYELRCQPPNSFDMDYTQNLGFIATRFLLSGGTGAMITVRDGRPWGIPFETILDPASGRIKTRRVSIESAYYRMCREYMVRLDRSDFLDQKRLSRLARVASCTQEEFQKQFGYLTEEDLGQSISSPIMDMSSVETVQAAPYVNPLANVQ